MVKVNHKLVPAGLCLASLMGLIVGMLLLMATRRGGSLLSWQYFIYVLPYSCAVALPLALMQYFTHQFQNRKGVRIEWLLLIAFLCAAMQGILGYFAALAFDF